MNWRDYLPESSLSNTENTQNTQKPIPDSGFVNSKSFVYGDEKFQAALKKITEGLDVTPYEIIERLSENDLEEWRTGKVTIHTIQAFAQSISFHRRMRKGIVPDHFKQHATCAKCGPIWYWLNVQISGCPWCWNRIHGRPIPRPVANNKEGTFPK